MPRSIAFLHGLDVASSAVCLKRNFFGSMSRVYCKCLGLSVMENYLKSVASISRHSVVFYSSLAVGCFMF